jgi:hypothetical protein
MTLQPTTGGAVSRTTPGGGALGEVLDRVLDKGIVIDAWAAVSLLGIEIVSIQAQVVVASVETYLKYARAMSAITLPEVEAPKKAAFKTSAAEASHAPAGRAPKAMGERPRPGEFLPSEDELVKYVGEHSGGLRLEQLAEHFHAPREQLEEAVSHLVDERKVRRDPARDLFLPAKG